VNPTVAMATLIFAVVIARKSGLGQLPGNPVSLAELNGICEPPAVFLNPGFVFHV